MKKKFLLITLAMALFMCVLAMGTYAAGFESSYAAEVTPFEGQPDWVNVDDKDATAVLKLKDGSCVRVPAYYIFKANSNNQFANNGSNFDFGWISEQLEETVNLDNLVAFEVPYGTKSFSGAISSGTFTALTELVVPTTVTSFPQKFLRDNVVMQKLFIKQTTDAEGNVVGVTKLPDYFADMQGTNVSALTYFKLELDYITAIGNNAFNKSAIREIKLQGPITALTGTCFSDCPNLTTVDINNTGDVITIGGKAFAYSPVLSSVTLNNISFSDYLFESVNGAPGTLTVVATNVGKFGTMVFKNATNLKSATISGPLTTIGSSAFNGCTNVETVVINNTSSTLATASGTFSENASIKNVTLNGIQIGEKMFYKVTTLVNLNLTNFGLTIGKEAFRYSTITSFTMPAGFTLIAQHAFADCKSLASFTFAGDAGENAVIGYASFENAKALTTFIIPEGVTKFGECPFKNAGLKYVSLPSTLTTLEGSSHFYGCPLETVIGFENTQITSIPDSMFRGQKLWKPAVLRIPDTVETIAKYGFADCGASVIILGRGVKTIGSEAFVNCANVKEFYLPDTITSISSDAFKNNVNKNIVFLVTSNDAEYLATIKTGTLVTNEAITHDVYKLNTESYATGRHLVYNCNVCEVLYGNAHSMAGEESISFNSYFEAITVGDYCTRDGCGSMVVTQTIDAIFVDRGYSCTEAAINGVYSVSQFYEINRAACEAYALATGTVIEYGFVVSISNDPLNAENSGLITAGKTYVTGSNLFKYDFVGVNVTGITDGENGTKNTLESALTFCMYVKDGGKIFYLDGGKTVSVVEQKSYSDILASMN